MIRRILAAIRRAFNDRRRYDILNDPLSRALREIYMPEEWNR
jgi:hypothetical protein